MITPADILKSLGPLPDRAVMASEASVTMALTRNMRPVELCPLESLKARIEQQSCYNKTIQYGFHLVAAADAYVSPLDGKRKRCHCGQWAYKYRLCPYHYYHAFYDIELGEPLPPSRDPAIMVNREYLTIILTDIERGDA